MFGKNKTAKRSNPVYVLDHKALLLENFQCTPQDFYQRVQAALDQRKIPEIKTERINWPEGGIFSPRREYLRAQRERLLFDICGAPFGTGFFVSTWFAVRPPSLGVVAIFYLILLALAVIDTFLQTQVGFYFAMDHFFGLEGFAALATLIAGFIVLFIVFLRTGLIGQEDFDAVFMRIPVVSYFYINFIRRITYYKIDNAEMYQQAVNNAVMQVVEEMTAPKGITPLSAAQSKPILRALWQRGCI